MDSLVTKIKGGKSKICFLVGAGISVSSGIPDFRSKGGMYDTLKPELLTATVKEKQLMKMEPTYVRKIENSALLYEGV